MNIVYLDIHSTVKPGEPQNLAVIDIGSDFAQISWEPPYILGSPPLTKYSIQWDGISAQTNSTTFYISKLLPGTEYTIVVTAVSDLIVAGGNESVITFQTDFSSE